MAAYEGSVTDSQPGAAVVRPRPMLSTRPLGQGYGSAVAAVPNDEILTGRR